MSTALYARFSSDEQRDASIDDQIRECCALAQRLGWAVPDIYADAAISGTRRDRPNYQRLLADIQRGAVTHLVLWDLKRLSRAEDLPQVLAQLRFARVHIVTCDGFDSTQEGSDLRGWLDALIGNRYLHDLAKATHRGLMGQALKGYSTGGLAYGYKPVAGADGNTRVIDPDQAAVVHEIFRRYAAGEGIPAICGDLNRRAVPPPRGTSWGLSAIYPDERGVGILSNPLYIGRQIWNRSKWEKNPATGRRVRKERPESEWVITDKPELAIVSQELWEATQSRAKRVRHKTKEAQARSGKSARGGREPKFLLSGLLKCGDCGGPMVIVDYYRYGCGNHKHRGDTLCTNSTKIARQIVEDRLLEVVRRDMLTDEAYHEFESAAREALRRTQQNPIAAKAALSHATKERDNILTAIRAGIITPSTKQMLEEAEAGIAAAERELEILRRAQPSQILPRAREAWRKMVSELQSIDDIPKAREALKDLLGNDIRIVRNDKGAVIAEIRGASESKIKVVAGAGFEPTTFGL